MTRKTMLVLGGFLFLIGETLTALVTGPATERTAGRTVSGSFSHMPAAGSDQWLSELGTVRINGDMPLDPSSWVTFGKNYSLAPKRLSCGCFAPGAAQDQIDLWFENIVGGLDDVVAYNLLCRWSGSNGSPRFLTWSFAPDTVFIPSGIGEPGGQNEIFSRLDAQFGGNRALWISKF